MRKNRKKPSRVRVVPAGELTTGSENINSRLAVKDRYAATLRDLGQIINATGCKLDLTIGGKRRRGHRRCMRKEDSRDQEGE